MGFLKHSKDIDVDDKSVYTEIFSTIEDGVVLFDASGIIKLFNVGAGKISGWEPKDALSLDVNSVIKLVDAKGEPYPEIENPFKKVFAITQTVKDNGGIVVNKSGQQISVNVSVFPLKYGGDKVNAAVAIIRNVSQERKEEERLADFISTASHEMRTPVAAIEGYLALALNERVASIDKRAREFLEKAHASTQSLGVLFQDLLTSAKAEDGRLASHPLVIEMSDFLKKITEDLKFSAEKKGLKTDFVLGSAGIINASSERKISPLYYAYADPNRLGEVIGNLFENAVKFTNSGKITVGLTGDDSVIQIYVKDTGAGMPKEDIPHLFQKFYRVDNSATRTVGGTGLGLYICQKIVELYNGRIWVESELGKGSSFYINLPKLTTQQASSIKSGAIATPQTTETETIAPS